MSNLPAPIDEFGNFGLDDFAPDQMETPRITINHDAMAYESNLDGSQWPQLPAVILGVVNGRVLFPSQMGDTPSKPMCKSYDGKVGKPDAGTFPWKAAKFDIKSWNEEEGLPCGSCPLKDFGSHPTRENAPWCQQLQHLVILTHENEVYAPAIFTVKSSGIKPLARYITSFKRTNSPIQGVHTILGLDHKTRGSVRYSVPTFRKGEETDPAYYGEWRDTFYHIREFLMTPWEPRDDDEKAEGSKSAAAMDDNDLAWDK